MNIPVTLENFDELHYLESNADVKSAVLQGQFKDGISHFRNFGHLENRQMRSSESIEQLRTKKMAPAAAHLRTDMECFKKGKKYNYLSERLRDLTATTDTDSVSANDYDGNILELIRALKLGGQLYCTVPFLQPDHGYPHHYFNMTHQGLKSPFDHALEVTDQKVLESTGSVWTLTWFLQRWSAQLPEIAKNQFLSLRVSDLIGSPEQLLSQEWVKFLPMAAQFELASATVLFATKPA